MDILESLSQLTPIDHRSNKDKLHFSCSVEAGLGDNSTPKYTFPRLSDTGYSPTY